jgi:hypothetical protein
MNDLDFTDAPKIWKFELGIKKQRKSFIKWSNPRGNQATHFISCTKSLNVENSYYNRKKMGTTSKYDLLYVYHPPTNGKHK